MAYPNDEGEWVIFNVESLEEIDSRRLKIGLEPIADYAKKRGFKLPSDGFYKKVFN